ncbi:hypothetical protein SAMN05660297_00221 [Natronincola peptidivorans]|uniref:Uncharacterized protein n=1 Tax=Natronincola peptidivorans TaxID=426128 RepID=A0A1H9YGC7_9FIRM|nr:hypothetical protein [Natronincola peptidivorans]SES68090.1 hypothetical protein SAMN05660297_00221 [Natronincola peptidivorans]
MNQTINIIFILFGSIVVIISLYILLQNRDNSINNEYASSFSNEDSIKKLEGLVKNENYKAMKEISKINDEISQLKDMLKHTEDLIDLKVKDNEDFNDENHSDNHNDNFKHLLNYNKFLKKNNDIINLFKQNKNLEEIARELNKSIREVEMVVKLVK